MAVVKSIADYRRLMEKRANNLVKAGNRSSLTAASFMVAQAKRMAPRSTGETMRGIRKRKRAKGKWAVESTVSPKGSKGFRQNLWANQTSPHASPRMKWNKSRPTRYGVGHRTSGVPGFFNKAAVRTRRQFNRLVRKNTINALRVTI